MNVGRVAVGCAVIGLSACKSLPEINAENLSSQWGDRFRAYEIWPVFPPREDLQVGDLYISCRAAETPAPPKWNSWLQGGRAQPKRPPISGRIARIDAVREALKASYATSIVMPAAAQTTDKTGNLPSSTGFMDGTGDQTRLRNVSLPEFFSATLTKAEGSALVPAGVVLAGIGLASEDVASVSVSVPSAGSYGLGAWEAFDSARKTQLWKNGVFWSMANGYLQAYQQSCQTGETASFLLVTEVFAAYSIEVNFNFSDGTAAKIQAAMQTPADSTRQQSLTTLLSVLTGKDEKPQDGGTGSGAGQAAVIDSQAKDTLATSDALKDALNALLASAAGSQRQQFPGISAQLVTGSSSGVKVNRTFANPVVVGYRGINLEANTTSDAAPVKVKPAFPVGTLSIEHKL